MLTSDIALCTIAIIQNTAVIERTEINGTVKAQLRTQVAYLFFEALQWGLIRERGIFKELKDLLVVTRTYTALCQYRWLLDTLKTELDNKI